MAIEFEWNGKRWEAKKVRRKLTQFEHRGLAYYDRERMRKPLAPLVHPPCGFDAYSAPPTWAEIPDSWGDWQSVPSGYFHNGNQSADGAPFDDLDSPPIAQTADYTLERCHVETLCAYYRAGWWRVGEPDWSYRHAMYRWELTFADGVVFQFASRAIAEAALAALLKIRKAKHTRPKYAKHSPDNDCVFFTDRKRAKLPADYVPVESPASVSAA